MKNVMVFGIKVFEDLVCGVTHGVMGFYNTMFDGWYWAITMDDDEWETFAEKFGEEAAEEVNKYTFDELENGDYVYAMIGKEFNAVVDEIIIDFHNERVAVIFE